MSLNSPRGEVYSILRFVIKFVSDLRHVDDTQVFSTKKTITTVTLYSPSVVKRTNNLSSHELFRCRQLHHEKHFCELK
jgi:hypothetical protein